MEYLELDPIPDLRPYVRAFWSLSSADARRLGPDHIIPDACPEIVLNRADAFRRHDVEGARAQERVLLVGPLTRAITISPTGAVDLIGIRFEPGGLHALLGMSLKELADLDVALNQVAPGLASELVDAVRRGPLASVRHRLERALLDQLERRRRRNARALGRRGLLDSILRVGANGVTNVETMSARLGLNRRALERIFQKEVGLSPKHYLRIARLQRVLTHLEHGPPREGWAALALAAGFVDQPHLIREFKLLAGATPARYLSERTAIAEAFEPR